MQVLEAEEAEHRAVVGDAGPREEEAEDRAADEEERPHRSAQVARFATAAAAAMKQTVATRLDFSPRATPTIE
jgi:hypothetical protein